MIEEVKKDILKILQETLDAFNRGDYMALKEISDHTIHNASIYQDHSSVSMAVIVFSIFKIASRSEGREKQVCKEIITALKDAFELLKRDRVNEYKMAVKKIFRKVSAVDQRFRIHIEQVINQAEVKKGSRLYEHGISMARAAEMLGVTEWELMNYVGKTRILELETAPFDIKARVSFAKKIFGI